MIDFISPIINVVLNPCVEEFIKQQKYKNEEKNKISILYENINQYTHSIYNKFSKTKTFLHRNEPVDFDKIYFDISLRKIENIIQNETDISVENIKDFFLKNNGCISLISYAGSGKTMLTKKIFLNSISQHIYTKKLPIFLELRNINCSIQQHLENILKVDNDISRKTLTKLLEKGSFIFLFDGYDEISLENKKNLTCDIEKFVDSYDKNYFLITSRPQAGTESFSRFTNYSLKDLNNKQINEFILKQLDDKELANKIISVIEENRTNSVITEYLKNPLLLSMFILEFENYPEIPTKKSIFYRNVYDTLCTRHDSFTKTGAYQHEKKSKLPSEIIEKIIELFSFLSFFEQKYSFDKYYLRNKLDIVKNSLKINFDNDDLIYDLTISISILIYDGEYKFPHRSIQEYFATNYIKKIQQEDIKNKIYQKMPLYLDSNFYNLCEEQDKIYFYKYFIIPNLESYIKNFNNMSENDICKRMLKNIKFGFTKDKKARTIEGGLKFREERFVNLFIGIYQISLFNVKDCDKIPNYFYDETDKDSKSTPTFYTIDFSKHINDQNFYKTICDIGLKDIIFSYIKKIKDKIEELKRIITSEEEKEKDILKLIS